MAILTSGAGSLKLSVPKGSALIIRNFSGTETVTGSGSAREDATAFLGAGAYVYGPQNAEAQVTISTTGTLDYSVVAGDPTPATPDVYVTRNPATGAPTGIVDGSGSTVSAGGGTLAEIVARHTAARNNNARVNATIPVSADGVAPTAGQLGFTTATTSATPSTHIDYNLRSLATNGVPENLWASGSGAPFRLLGSMPYLLGTTRFQAITHWFRDGTTFQRSNAQLQFVVDAPSFIVTMNAVNTLFLTIDDGTGPKRVADIAVTGSGTRDVTLDFSQIGGRKRRVITILFSSGDISAINTIKVPKSASFGQLDARPPQIVTINDSLGNTVKNGEAINAFTATLADYLGCEVYPLAEGSTGYTTRGDGPTTKRTFAERVDLAKSMSNYIRPTLGVFFGGTNDTDLALLATEVDNAITKWLASFPNAPLLVFGPWTGSGTVAITASQAKEDTIKAVVDKYDRSRVRFIPTMRAVPPYVSGSGNTGAAANDGNADLILDPGDPVHWNTYGHSQAIGPRVADDIVAAVRSLAGLA